MIPWTPTAMVWVVTLVIVFVVALSICMRLTKSAIITDRLLDAAILLLVGCAAGFLLSAVLQHGVPLTRTSNALAPASTELDALPVPSSARIDTLGVMRAGHFFKKMPLHAIAGAHLAVNGTFANNTEQRSVLSSTAMVESTPVTAQTKFLGDRFVSAFPTAGLLPGSHSLTLLFRTRDGQALAASPRIGFVLSSPSAGRPSTAASNQYKFDGGIDVFSPLDGAPARNLDVLVNSEQQILIEGWAFDLARNKAADLVSIDIDGRESFQASTGLARPDVATAKGDAYRNTGYRAVIDCGDLTGGRHELRVIAGSSSSSASYAYTTTLTLNVRIDTP